MPLDKVARNRQNAPSRNKYNASTYDNITFRLHQDGSDGVSREQLQAAAAASGQSVNQWIIDAIKDKI